MKNWFKNNPVIFIYLVILFVSILPVYYTWGRLKIGGDVMIPFDIVAINKYLSPWLSIQNGGYYVQNYLPLYLLYLFASFFKLSIYETSSLIYFLISFFGGLGIYNITLQISNKNPGSAIRLIPVFFYLFSPALLNGWQYLYLYGVLPWFFYFLFKLTIQNKFSFSDLLYLQITIFFGSLDLPNPKYLFYFFIATVVSIATTYYLGVFNVKKIKYLLLKVVLFFLLSSYIILPLLYFTVNYQAGEYGVHVRTGYQDQGKMMDFGNSTTRQMLTLHHGANMNEPQQVEYLSNPFSIIGGYLVILFITINLLTVKNNTNYFRIKILLSVLIILFLFLSIGPNPPFGFLYELIVTKIGLFAFLRTTAGAVFPLALLYSIFLYIQILEEPFHRKLYGFLSILVILVIGYPMIFGSYYNNSSKINNSANTLERGFVLPDEYLNVSDKINHLRLDQRTYFPVSNSSYLSTNWGYFGPPIYLFLYQNYPIFSDKIFSIPQNHGVGVVFVDNNISSRAASFISSSDNLIANSGNIQVLETNRKDYQPHLVVQSASSSSIPVLEYKKINSSRYRVVVHRAKDDLKLILSEQYNKHWLLYNNSKSLAGKKPDLKSALNTYKILDSNSTDQASSEELSNYIKNNLISTLGDYSNKEDIHYRWEKGRKIIDYKEYFQIDFVSKNYQNTIQNNNLPSIGFYETMFQKPVNVDEHLVENGYANSWKINVSSLCEYSELCVKNTDESYDIEFILSFWPQDIAYLGYLVSLLTIVGCSYLAYIKIDNV